MVALCVSHRERWSLKQNRVLCSTGGGTCQASDGPGALDAGTFREPVDVEGKARLERSRHGCSVATMMTPEGFRSFTLGSSARTSAPLVNSGIGHRTTLSMRGDHEDRHVAQFAEYVGELVFFADPSGWPSFLRHYRRRRPGRRVRPSTSISVLLPQSTLKMA